MAYATQNGCTLVVYNYFLKKLVLETLRSDPYRLVVEGDLLQALPYEFGLQAQTDSRRHTRVISFSITDHVPV